MITHARSPARSLQWLVVAVLAAASTPARAAEFGLFDNQLSAVWKTQLTLGVAWRNYDPDPQHVGAGARAPTPGFPNGEFPGATGAVGVNDEPNLNFPDKYDMVSAPLTIVSEISLIHPSGQGVFVRARLWYDLFLKGEDVPHGNATNSFTANSRLSDDGHLGAARYNGGDFYDAYYFANFSTGPATWQVRLGRQAVDWGEGIFYPGFNSAVNPYDYAWLTMTGAPVLNGGKLPVGRLYANVATPSGWTFDGFYNYEWRTSTYPGCGTYYQGLDNSMNPGCNAPTTAGLSDVASLAIRTRNYYNGQLPRGGNFPNGSDDPRLDSRPMTGEPSQWSGWGLSARTFIERAATEVGFYYTDYVSQSFVNAAVIGPSPLDFSVNTIFPTRVKSYGVSASSGIRNLVMSGQLMFTRDFAAHYNAPGYIIGSNATVGAFGFMRAECLAKNGPAGGECQTHHPTNITQFQLGGTWQFGEKVGLPDATLTGETVMLWNTNLGPQDGPRPIRLGRYGNYGESDWTNSVGYACNPGPLANGIVNRCEVEGFVTPFAWGYKLRLAATMPRGPGLTFVPMAVFGHDLKGFSADGMTVNENRMNLGATLRTIFKQNYYVDVGAVWYKRSTKWDGQRDKGQYTVSFGMNVN